MMRRVEYAKRARNQLRSIYEYVANAASQRIAEGFVADISHYCDGLSSFPERGSRRDDLRPGLRLVGFRRRVTIAFRIDAEAVRILGVFYGGRNIEAAFSDEAPPDE
jgi:toxin ParE1/3/4